MWNKIGRTALGFGFLAAVGFAFTMLLTPVYPDAITAAGGLTLPIAYVVAWKGWQGEIPWYAKAPALLAISIIPFVNWIVVYWIGNALLLWFDKPGQTLDVQP